MSKVIVIGAGPAGIMSAITASKKHEVILLDVMLQMPRI